MNRRIGIGLVLVSLVLAGLAVSAKAEPNPLSRRQRGIVLDGLNAKDGGKCQGVFRIELGQGTRPQCSHGPDPAPDGVDVTEDRSVEDLATATAGDSISSTGVPCLGDGTSGSRVQAIYAVASDRSDRYDSIAPMIRTWAGQMDTVVRDSAAETGGELHLRFVTTPDCELDVAHVILSPTGDDTFSNTIAELRNKGFSASNRKYLLWADATVYCGISQVTGSDSAATSNPANNGPNYGRVDSGCWARSDHLSEVHELMHTLGAVQRSAPNATSGYHCTDERDLMCYSDASGVTMTNVCPDDHEWLLDCNHDDYFSTAPPSGSYLATHWNVATSVFLTAWSGDGSSGTSPGSTSPSPTASPTPAPTWRTTTFGGSLSNKRSSKTFPLSIGGGDVTNALQFSGTGKGGKVGTSPSLTLRILAGDGTVLAEGSGPTVLRFATTLPRGTYTWEVSGSSSVSFSLAVTYVVP